MSRQVVGIDLGTSNSAVARFEPQGNALEQVDLMQRISSVEVGSRSLLPSFLYLPGEYELPTESTSLPWDPERRYLVGEYARYQGARVPGRCVVSAKSWLAHRTVDPTEPNLPWDRAKDLRPVSPVQAVTRYLEHIVEAWNHRFPEESLQGSEVILTIPASFDDLARKLTAGAAASVGLPVRLLEEPQAAFYAWLWQHRKDWKKRILPGEVILVCDIGGGTTDFSLIRYHDGGELERVAVGDHLMLGGDNIDIALAYMLEPKLKEKLNPLQWGVLRQQCRAGKELLLAEGAPDTATITVPGSGSALLGGALSAELGKDEVVRLVLDGFFPLLDYEDIALKGGARGLKELGLPYESDPAVPRHLSRFLHAHPDHFPTRVLFNGGAGAPALIRERLVTVLSGWRKSLGHPGPVVELESSESHLAVARGAAWYGHQRLSEGVVVEGGTARSYYVGLPDRQALCVVSSSTREGRPMELAQPRLKLKVGEPAAFPLFTSSRRPKDEPGQLLSTSDLTPLPVLQTSVEGKGIQKGSEVSVHLAAEVTPVGTLDLRFRSDDRQEFRLEFSVRDGVAGAASADLARAEVDAARSLLTETFKAKPKALKNSPVRPKNLLLALEQTLGETRDEWPPVVLRTLWDSYWSVESRRRVSEEFEAAWLNGVGFCLRPGFGLPLDEWRCLQLEKVLDGWLQHSRDENVKVQFFIMWRRVAAGLRTATQLHLWDQLHPLFLPGRKHIKTRNKGNPGREDRKEMLRLAVSLERIPMEEKRALLEVLLEGFSAQREEFWLLARLAAREPLDPEAKSSVLPGEAVGSAIDALLASPWQNVPLGELCLVNVASRTADPTRDLDAERFARVEEAVQQRSRDPQSLARLRGEAARSSRDASALYGDSIPLGLRLDKERPKPEAESLA